MLAAYTLLTRLIAQNNAGRRQKPTVTWPITETHVQTVNAVLVKGGLKGWSQSRILFLLRRAINNYNKAANWREARNTKRYLDLVHG